jgi:hypothetical protein
VRHVGLLSSPNLRTALGNVSGYLRGAARATPGCAGRASMRQHVGEHGDEADQADHHHCNEQHAHRRTAQPQSRARIHQAARLDTPPNAHARPRIKRQRNGRLVPRLTSGRAASCGPAFNTYPRWLAVVRPPTAHDLERHLCRLVGLLVGGRVAPINRHDRCRARPLPPIGGRAPPEQKNPLVPATIRAARIMEQRRSAAPLPIYR